MDAVLVDSDPLTAAIVAFCRFVRSQGLPVGLQQTLAALETAKAVGSGDRQLFAFALRAVLCSSHEEWEEFDRLFATFWSRARSSLKDAGKNPGPVGKAALRSLRGSRMLAGLSDSAAASPEDEGKLVLGASSQQRLKRMDFSEAPQTDLAVLEQLSLRLLRQMSLRLSRRLKIESAGNRVDLRRTIRRNVTRGGDPFVLAYKGRKPQPKRLVIFLDISGSMNLYSLFLLRFAYALQECSKRVDTFLFSTSVVKVSDILRRRQLSDVLNGLSHGAVEWSGGTKIGGSLAEFNRQHSRRVLSRRTVFIILSDGWDTGEPEALAVELQKAKRRVEKLIWLNPLLGLKQYEPITRGMKAALPYVDVFAPAHNLESLLALEKHL